MTDFLSLADFRARSPRGNTTDVLELGVIDLKDPECLRRVADGIEEALRSGYAAVELSDDADCFWGVRETTDEEWLASTKKEWHRRRAHHDKQQAEDKVVTAVIALNPGIEYSRLGLLARPYETRRKEMAAALQASMTEPIKTRIDPPHLAVDGIELSGYFYRPGTSDLVPLDEIVLPTSPIVTSGSLR